MSKKLNFKYRILCPVFAWLSPRKLWRQLFLTDLPFLYFESEFKRLKGFESREGIVIPMRLPYNPNDVVL